MVRLPTPDRFGPVRAFDRLIDAQLDRVRGNRLADRLFYSASEAANFSALWHALAWLPVLLTRRGAARAAATSAALVAESVIVNGAVKSLFDRPRPSQGEPRPMRLRSPRTSSFPSGHASAAQVAVALLGAGRAWPVRAALQLAGAIVGASRAYVRIHHGSDVVAGAAVGVALGRVARRLSRPALG